MNVSLFAIPKICVRVTQRCNLECPFCLAPLYRGRELSVREIVSILGFLRHNGLRSVSISGGEPLLRDDLEELLCNLRELDLDITMATNAILVSAAQIEILQRTGCKVKVNLVGGESTHNALVGRDVFKTVDKNVKRLLMKQIPVGINTVVTRRNRQALGEVISYAADNKISRVRFILFVPRGKGSLYEHEFALTANQIREVEAEIERLRFIHSRNLSIRYSNYWIRFPYYVLESDGRLVAEGPKEDNDVIICQF